MWILLTISSIVFIIIVYLVLLEKVTSFDNHISKMIINKRNDKVTQAMLFFTYLGKGGPTLIICILLLFLPNTGNVLQKSTCLGVFSTIFISKFLKQSIKRARPEGNRLVEETDFSFPSAHALCSAALYGGIALNSSAFENPLSLIVISISILFIFFIGYSRIYLGIHFLTDVIGGWSLGLVIAVLFTLLFNYL